MGNDILETSQFLFYDLFCLSSNPRSAQTQNQTNQSLILKKKNLKSIPIIVIIILYVLGYTLVMQCVFGERTFLPLWVSGRERRSSSLHNCFYPLSHLIDLIKIFNLRRIGELCSQEPNTYHYYLQVLPSNRWYTVSAV